MSASNKVFERYYKTEGAELKNVYGKTKRAAIINFDKAKLTTLFHPFFFSN
jgi:hypothetical protein